MNMRHIQEAIYLAIALLTLPEVIQSNCQLASDINLTDVSLVSDLFTSNSHHLVPSIRKPRFHMFSEFTVARHVAKKITKHTPN